MAPVLTTSNVETLRFSPMDVISSIIAYSQVDAFPSDREHLHNFFKTMKQCGEFSPLLENFTFSQVDIYPFSRELESLFTLLQLSRLIIIDNPRFSQYRVNLKLRDKILVTITTKFDVEQRELLEKLGKEFKRVMVPGNKK